MAPWLVDIALLRDGSRVDEADAGREEVDAKYDDDEREAEAHRASGCARTQMRSLRKPPT